MRRASWTALFLVVLATADGRTARQSASDASGSPGAIAINAVPVPLNPASPSTTAIGDFHYAGGLVLSSSQTDLLHELSDMTFTSGEDRFAAVGDGGVFLEARLVLDGHGRLVGVTDAILTRLVGENGAPLFDEEADAEGLALLPSGDRLISFETSPRILLYPQAGGRPRAVPWPRAPFPSNAGMEALAAAPDAGDDAYVVGGEDSGETWTCRVSGACAQGSTVDKPAEFGLVAMNRLSPDTTAYLLRAYDDVRGVRVSLRIVRGATVVARMDIARPFTVDNYEGMMSLPRGGGGRRFYLLSDDNQRATQRTLLVAFDWQPR